ncbi:MAG: dUTP diphosphatase [Paracoccaceae bacterium]
MLEVAVSWTKEADQDLGLPKFETDGAAGADLRANLNSEFRSSGVSLAPLQRELIPTGLCFEIPTGVEGQLRPRSGLALKYGMTLLNAPGTIDSDYRGPIGLIMINMGEFEFKITHGMRVAQIVFAATLKVQFKVSKNLSQTIRSDSGFGSTGTK